jgi:sirohydrochlorin ferrochelatase
VTPTLVTVAHGSRDPHSAATVRRLVAEVRAQAPELDVRESFLDLSVPRLADVLSTVDNHDVVVVPLLLGSAYHARVDLPALVAAASARRPGPRVSVTDVLGLDPMLETVALDRLAGSGAGIGDPDLGVLLAAVGSSDPRANAAVSAMAARWRRRGLTTVAAFAGAARPDVHAAVAELRARGAKRLAVASWFLAPGLLPDRVVALARAADPDVAVSAPLGPDPRVAAVVLTRFAAAAALTAA